MNNITKENFKVWFKEEFVWYFVITVFVVLACIGWFKYFKVIQ